MKRKKSLRVCRRMGKEVMQVNNATERIEGRTAKGSDVTTVEQI